MKLIVCILVASLAALPAISQDVPPAAVVALRLMAKQIQDCPQSLSSERRWGKNANEVERWYFGPPMNVAWDVIPSKTPVRSPFEAYVEFSTSYAQWIPPEVRAKYESMNFAPAIFLLYDHKFRYEFDVSPAGVTLMKALTHPSQQSREWETFDKHDVCWDKILRGSPQPQQ